MSTCENCAHRYVDLPTPGNPNASGQSICRRYPPQVVIHPANGQGLTLFPPVSPQMSCGEWTESMESKAERGEQIRNEIERGVFKPI